MEPPLDMRLERIFSTHGRQGIVADLSSENHRPKSRILHTNRLEHGGIQTERETFPANSPELPCGSIGGNGGSPQRKKRAKIHQRAPSRHLRALPAHTCAHQRRPLHRTRSPTGAHRLVTCAIDLVNDESDVLRTSFGRIEVPWSRPWHHEYDGNAAGAQAPVHGLPRR